jgi:hypothetical protein
MKSGLCVGLAGMCLLLTGLLFSMGASAEPPRESRPAKPIQRWQHMALTHVGARVSGDEVLNNRINEVGNEGWELVSVTDTTRNGTTEGYVFFFKRPR